MNYGFGDSAQFNLLIDAMLDLGIPFAEAKLLFKFHFIERALIRSDYNISATARMTGLHRNSLTRSREESRDYLRARIEQAEKEMRK